MESIVDNRRKKGLIVTHKQIALSVAIGCAVIASTITLLSPPRFNAPEARAESLVSWLRTEYDLSIEQAKDLTLREVMQRIESKKKR